VASAPVLAAAAAAPPAPTATVAPPAEPKQIIKDEKLSFSEFSAFASWIHFYSWLTLSCNRFTSNNDRIFFCLFFFSFCRPIFFVFVQSFYNFSF
jgi:hypothetical protein